VTLACGGLGALCNRALISDPVALARCNTGAAHELRQTNFILQKRLSLALRSRPAAVLAKTIGIEKA
jgi:hypothetical protein